MGEGSEWIADSSGGENRGLGTYEAHDVCISPEKDRRGSKDAVGEGTGGGEDGSGHRLHFPAFNFGSMRRLRVSLSELLSDGITEV